jgi:dTDP-4-dehydrorhamnose reductase
MSFPKLAVTGASGFVGGHILQQALPEWEVYALSRTAPSINHERLHSHKLPLNDQQVWDDWFLEYRPDAIIHCAAIANIDTCEFDHALADSVNVRFTETVVQAAKKTSTKVVFVSTDNVFNSSAAFVTEQDPVYPENYYGQTKVKSEQIVLDGNTSSVAARICLVMGQSVFKEGNSFMSRMVPQLQQGNAIQVPNTETRTPIDVITCAQALVELAGNTFSGTIHLSGIDAINRFDLVRKIARKLGVDEQLVEPFDPSGLPNRGPRPESLLLSNQLAQGILRTKMKTIDESITQILG